MKHLRYFFFVFITHKQGNNRLRLIWLIVVVAYFKDFLVNIIDICAVIKAFTLYKCKKPSFFNNLNKLKGVFLENIVSDISHMEKWSPTYI